MALSSDLSSKMVSKEYSCRSSFEARGLSEDLGQLMRIVSRTNPPLTRTYLRQYVLIDSFSSAEILNSVIYRLTEHARDALAKRGIRTDWLERAIASPQRTEPDSNDPALEHRLATISDHGDRVLRVIINIRNVPEWVVTAYFDRTMKGKL
jgi:hypothetical protein